MEEYYAGIGSRSAPRDVLEIMTAVAARREKDGLILRSGGADGSDSSFEKGVVALHMKEIYLPWKGFNGRQAEVSNIFLYNEEHERIAAEHHRSWERLSRGVRLLHTRNVAQVLGKDCKTPSKHVLCWTADGGPTGGTGQAIRVAYSNSIPVFNLFWGRIQDMLKNYVVTGEFDENAWIP